MSAVPPQRKKIAALVPNVLGFSPGQRVRIERWASGLEEAGWSVEFYPFEDSELHELLYSPGNILRKITGLARCYHRQLGNVSTKIDADVLFVYREAALIGPAILERIAARRGIPMVFDIDDPAFLPYKSPTNSWASLLKFSRKTHCLFRISSRIITINQLIGNYAARFNPNVTVIPNMIDTDIFKPPSWDVRNDLMPTRLIWIGSRSTMQNLMEIVAPIRRIQYETNAKLTVIGTGILDLGISDVEFLEWSAETEVSDLQTGDIGLLPVNDLPWNKWKFFFKTIQYMAVGIPVVARRIGSNEEIIEDGINGFLVSTEEEWYERIRFLIDNAERRREMGRAARRTVIERFSLESQMPRIIDLFEEELRSHSAARRPIGARPAGRT